MADYITRIRTAEGDKKYDYNSLANLPASVTDVTNTVISPNADYAEVGEWADGNPGEENRLGYFVAVAEVGDNTIKIRKATSSDDVRGVSVYNPAFSGNASEDKYGNDGELLPQYNYIGVMGIVSVIDNGRCAVNGRCMPGDDGTAVPSTNNMGYAVLERVDATHVLIAVEPGADMIQRVKTDIKNMEGKILGGASVKKYGAKGDGSTDDTAAFQNALAENRTVLVPEGTYKLSGKLVIGANCRMEMSQATVLNFTQTSGNCIEMRSSATLAGNHGTIQVPYGFTGNVVSADTVNDATKDTPPYTHWSPQWKRARYIYDVCIVKPDPTHGLHYSLDGTCSGTGVYMSCDGTAEVGYIWGALLQGVRIAGAFTYGIRVINFDDPNDSMEDDAWNHDMRIEAVIQGCEISASLTNCNHAHLAVTVQPCKANNEAKYAKWGVYLNDCKNIDMTQSFVWDWHVARDGAEYTHIAMYGNCKGLILNEPRYYDRSVRDVRDIIYTDTQSNLENMVVLQEPITRWFKPKDGEPYFFDGDREERIALQSDIEAHFATERVKGFTDALAISTDASGAIYNGVGYKRGGYFDSVGTEKQATGNEYDYYISTGYIPVKPGDVLYLQNLSFDSAIAINDASCKIAYFDANKQHKMLQSGVTLNSQGANGGYYQKYVRTEDGMKITLNPTLSEWGTGVSVRFVFHMYDFGENPVISVNEEIKYTYEGYLADGIKVKGENVVGGAGGGGEDSKLLVVTVDENSMASHTAAEIDEWANNGGMVVLDKGGFTYTLYAHMPTFARFRGWQGPDSMLDVAILAGNGYQSRTEKNIHLPTVTEEDNGKSLQVVDGAWTAAEGGGGTSIDVTASVGQTIIVKEVDASGKPTKWESAEYQPRTHWQGEKVLFQFTFDGTDAAERNLRVGAPAIGLIAGKTYKVVLNDVTYTLVAKLGVSPDMGYSLIWLGNPVVVGGTADATPFCIADIVGSGGWAATGMAAGTRNMTIISNDEAHTIPTEYLTGGFPYVINVFNIDDEYGNIGCVETVAEIAGILQSGREVKARFVDQTTRKVYIYSLCGVTYTEFGCALIFDSLLGLSLGDDKYLLVLTPSEQGIYTASHVMNLP